MKVKIYDADDMTGEPLATIEGLGRPADLDNVLCAALEEHGEWIEWSFEGFDAEEETLFVWSFAYMFWSIVRSVRRGEPIFFEGQKYAPGEAFKKALQANSRKSVRMSRDSFGYIHLDVDDSM